jgi:hypothetical protein
MSYEEEKYYDPIYIDPKSTRKYVREGATITEYWRDPNTWQWSHYSTRTYASEEEAKNKMHSHWWYTEEKDWGEDYEDDEEDEDDE